MKKKIAKRSTAPLLQASTLGRLLHFSTPIYFYNSLGPFPDELYLWPKKKIRQLFSILPKSWLAWQFEGIHFGLDFSQLMFYELWMHIKKVDPYESSLAGYCYKLCVQRNKSSQVVARLESFATKATLFTTVFNEGSDQLNIFLPLGVLKGYDPLQSPQWKVACHWQQLQDEQLHCWPLATKKEQLSALEDWARVQLAPEPIN